MEETNRLASFATMVDGEDDSGWWSSNVWVEYFGISCFFDYKKRICICNYINIFLLTSVPCDLSYFFYLLNGRQKVSNVCSYVDIVL